MKLPSKSRYAVMVMMHLALHDHEGPIALAELSRIHNISLSYLEQLFVGLRNAELVEGVRGPGGGCRLKRPADDITIAEILGAVNPETNSYSKNKFTANHLTQTLWEELNSRMENFLQDMTLADFTGTCHIRTPLFQDNSLSGHINSMFPARAALA